MENVIYIDELIKKVMKCWKSILILTIIVMAIMGIHGYNIAQSQGNDYVYRSVFVVTNSDYENTSDTMRLVDSVFKSNLLGEKVVKDQAINRSGSAVSSKVQIGTDSNGTVVINMTVDKWLAEEIDFACFKAYYEIGIETLLEKFPNCDVTVIDEPYVQTMPMDSAGKQTVAVRLVLRYVIYGAILGLIVSCFFTAIRILWNPREYEDRKERI